MSEDQRTDPSPIALIEASVWRRLFDHRTVYLRGPIMEQVADTLCAQLMALDAESDRDVTMFVNSPGGEMTGMFAVYDVVQLMRSRVHTVCVGMAASAGSFLLATGTGVRSATPNSRIMIHQPHGGVQGTSADVQIQARQHLWMRERMSQIYAERTGRDVAEITRDTDRDRWFSAAEAVDYGLVDRVQIGSLP
jgi:ATP-dependent Clp protease protease subunit